jgi:hypothetical protein
MNYDLLVFGVLDHIIYCCVLLLFMCCLIYFAVDQYVCAIFAAIN